MKSPGGPIGVLGEQTLAVLFAIYRLMPFYDEIQRASGEDDATICCAMLDLQKRGYAELLKIDGRFIYRLTEAGKYHAAILRQEAGRK